MWKMPESEQVKVTVSPETEAAAASIGEQFKGLGTDNSTYWIDELKDWKPPVGSTKSFTGFAGAFESAPPPEPINALGMYQPTVKVKHIVCLTCEHNFPWKAATWHVEEGALEVCCSCGELTEDPFSFTTEALNTYGACAHEMPEPPKTEPAPKLVVHSLNPIGYYNPNLEGIIGSDWQSNKISFGPGWQSNKVSFSTHSPSSVVFGGAKHHDPGPTVASFQQNGKPLMGIDPSILADPQTHYILKHEDGTNEILPLVVKTNPDGQEYYDLTGAPPLSNGDTLSINTNAVDELAQKMVDKPWPADQMSKVKAQLAGYFDTSQDLTE